MMVHMTKQVFELHDDVAVCVSGMIESEVCQRVGGLANLMQDVEKGNIKMKIIGGIKLYFLPRVRIGTAEEVKLDDTAGGAKEISTETFKALRDNMLGLGATLLGEGASSSSQVAGVAPLLALAFSCVRFCTVHGDVNVPSR